MSCSYPGLKGFFMLAVVMTVSATGVYGQSNTSSFSNADLTINVSNADRSSASSAVRGYKHVHYARTPAGAAARSHAALLRQPSASSAGESGEIARDSYTQNPGDVSYQGGHTVQYAASHAVYFNPARECTIAKCWGDPEGFLADVGRSDFIHILDQYVGLNSNRRYTLGSRIEVLTNAPPSAPLSESDLIGILHAVVAATGASGYGNIYHLFLPPGVDTCFDAPSNGSCYSPDNTATFAFCAYHDSVTYSDLGHVLFTVEPWQGPTSGCGDSPVGAPNGQLIDSTNDTLSHELFETISDPDGEGWWNTSNFSLDGNEIADECLFLGTDNYTILPTFPVNGHLYRVQSEYANNKHACSISPHE